MSERLIARMLAPLERALGNIVIRGMVSVVDDSTKVQTLQVSRRATSGKAFIEHLQHYGLSVNPKRGAEHLSLSFFGDESHGVTIMVADRRYRLKGLAEGEVALYDDLGQKIHLTRSGIVIDGAGLPLNIQNSPHVIMTTAKLTVTGELEVGGNITAFSGSPTSFSMSAMKTTYNGHTHSDPQGGSVGTPSATM